MRDASFTAGSGSAHLNETHDPALRSFVVSANRADAGFPIQNLPLAVFRSRLRGGDFRVGAGIGDLVLDIGEMGASLAAECGPAVQACRGVSMKALMELGPVHWARLRLGLSRLLREGAPCQREAEQHLHPIADAEFLLPLKIGNFSDYLASMHHISKVIRVKRPDHPELPQSFVWSPIAYHSRASTVRASGYGFARPRGQAGGKALYTKVDVSDDDSVKGMVRQTLARFGRVDGLINNAAYFREVKLTDFDQIDPAQWDRIFAVNVKGTWQCCKAVMPAMREQGSGAIVNIASVVAVAGQPGYLQYVASKGAVLSLTKGLAKEVGKHGVRVNCIAPGFVLTDATRNRPAEWQQSFLKARALSREQQPDDLVGTAIYLVSDLAGFVSGQTIVVDGGHIMY